MNSRLELLTQAPLLKLPAPMTPTSFSMFLHHPDTASENCGCIYMELFGTQIFLLRPIMFNSAFLSFQENNLLNCATPIDNGEMNHSSITAISKMTHNGFVCLVYCFPC